jgi:hypothetical protein
MGERNKYRNSQIIMPSTSDIIKLAGKRTTLIDQIIESMEKTIGEAQGELLERVVTDFVDTLDKDADGNIKNSTTNRRKLQKLDKIYSSFVQSSGVQIVNNIIEGVNQTLDFNGKYYGVFTSKAELGKLMGETQTAMQDWLGLNNRGGLVENGYLNTLINDQTTKRAIQDLTFKSIIGQQGYQVTKGGLKDFIVGNKNKAGALQQYYRNFVYDTFSQADRIQGKIMADKLNMNKYAIYEGGLIKTSRKFCKDRNGKVFTSAEIEKFDPQEARQPNYNPFTDLGGYGCRHHLNWIPEAIAFALRPDLRAAR